MASGIYSRKKVAIIGMGVTTSLGHGIDQNWYALLSGRSGVRKITRFNTQHLNTCIGATVERYDSPHRLGSAERTYNLAREVVQEALYSLDLDTKTAAQAHLYHATHQSEPDWEDRFSMVRALLPRGVEPSLERIKEAAEWHRDACRLTNSSSMALRLASTFGFSRRVITLTTACASGASAIGLAVDAIRRKDTDLAVAVGADACISPENMTRFSLLSALSAANEYPEKASKPFDAKRDGFVMGEGAGCLVLADDEWARNVGYDILGYIHGYGSATDSYHKTRSNPDASMIVKSMQRALEDSRLRCAQIKCINAHGTSTVENDKVESLGINLLFREQAKQVRVTSNKSMIGHTLCASGVIEAIFSLLSIRGGIIPPTINYEHEDKDIEVKLVKNEAEKVDVDYVLSNSFGFGGQNVSLVVGGP